MDKRPLWWDLTERAFDMLRLTVTWLVILWGLGIFVLVAYGLWLTLTTDLTQ